jgi:2-aminoadipate transaminase
MVSVILARRASAVHSGPIDDLFAALAHRPEVISFAVGAPDPAVFPRAAVMAPLVETAIGKYGPAVLQYGKTQGWPPMLDQARTLLRQRHIHCSLDKIHISTGASGALHNVAMAMLDPGDVVLVETPTYEPAIKTFRSFGATAVAVDCDALGLLPDALDAALARHRPAFVYALPTFQNPTGRTMPASRRAEVAEVILRRGVVLVEDDVYSDLRYDGAPIPAFWSFAPENTVYITSLSKTFAPAMRIGIVVMPPHLLDSVFAFKQSIDMQTSSFCQAIAAEFLAGPEAGAHLADVVSVYARKLDKLSSALRDHLPPEFRWTRPEGGMFIWVEGPRTFDADATLRRALDAGVAFLPGKTFYTNPEAHGSTFRLSFAGVEEDMIRPGIELLGELCAQ